MKKIGMKLGTICMAFLLMFSIVTMTGCSNSMPKDGVIKGNYKDVSQEELNTLMANIDGNKTMGDQTSSDWQFGYKFSGNIEMSTIMGENSMTLSMPQYELSANLTKDEAGKIQMQAKGEMQYITNSQSEGKTTNNSLSTTFYIDNQNMYLDATINENGKEQSVQGKAESSMLDEIFDAFSLDMSITDMDFTEIKEAIQQMQQQGFKVQVDTKKGTKFKIFADEGVFESSFSVAGNNIQIQSSVYEIYFYFDQDGKLLQMAQNINMSMTMSLGGQNMTTTIKSQIGCVVDDVKISIPEEVYSYEDWKM